MNEAAVQKQIANMISFIQKEADEKASEIQVKADEEFTIEKSRLVHSQKQKIAAEFERKEKSVIVSKKISHSNDLAKSRLQLLKAQEAGVQRILQRAQQKLDEISRSPEYKDLLVKLILQGLKRLGDEDKVEVIAREEDQAILKEALPLATEAWNKSNAMQVTLVASTSYLPPSPANAGPKALKTCSGGVILSARGRTVCNNTLDVRLTYAYEHAVPTLRKMLFTETPASS